VSLQSIEKKIIRKVGKAIHDFGMISEGDRIMVGLSGGKDSWTLLHTLHELKKRAPIKFDIFAVTVHPGFEGFATSIVEEHCKEQGYNHFVEPTVMEKILEEKTRPGTTYCSLCARLRRGVLYSVAKREGYTKVALGHHADDLIETLLMTELFNGEIKSMPPVLQADDGVNVLIRPLCYVFEQTIIDFTMVRGFPLIPCGCPMKCGTDVVARKRVKRLLSELEEEHPGVKANLLASLGRVRESTLMNKITTS
jgi:tRNA 2-thiocytidine biosynthesis protein TtcA